MMSIKKVGEGKVEEGKGHLYALEISIQDWK
jgi:hypothetical protein